MAKKITVTVIILTVIAFLVIKGWSYLGKIEVNTSDPQASSDIKKSKDNGLFLKEYEVAEVTGNFFEVKEAWVEYTWRNGFEGNELRKIKTGRTQLTLKLINYLDSNIKSDNYLFDWEMNDIVNGSLGSSGVYSVSLEDQQLPDSFTIIINKINNNGTRSQIGQFVVRRK